MAAEEIGPAEKTEQRVLDDLLDGLSGTVVPGRVATAGDEAGLAREFLEVFGMLALENEPLTPSQTVKERLLRRVRGPVDPVNVGLAPIESSTESRRGPWALPLAAALAVLLLGVSGWQYRHLSQQKATIDGLSERLSAKNVELTDLATTYGRQLERMQSQLALVTSKGVEVCELKPQVAEVAATGARGALFVASDHQHWYLRIDDLEPCPQGRTYQLWFVLGDGTAVDGGILDVRHGVELEVTSDTMPEGTTAVHVTLEPAGGSPQPSGPMVLYGDETLRIL